MVITPAAPNAKAQRIALVMYIIAAISTVGAFLLPIPLSFQIPLALGLIVAEMHTGACIIYFSSFRKFTRRLKVAYSVVCAGSIFVALGAFQLLIVNALGWQFSDWVSYGGTELPILIGLFLGFTGYSFYASLLDIKYARWSPLVVGLLCLSMLAIFPNLPHVPKLYPEAGLDIAMSMSAMHGVTLLAGIILLTFMKHRAGPLYTPALAWTLLAFLFGLFASGQQLFLYLFVPDDHWYIAYRLYTISIGLSGLFSLRAALMFSAIPSASKLSIYSGKLSFFGKPKWRSEQSTLSPVDMVIFTSGLASDVRAVDPSLDRIRILTSMIDNLDNISPDAVEVLANAYREIESYLTTKEPVRRYTQKELRELVKNRFQGLLDQAPFWQAVEKKQPSITEKRNLVVASDTTTRR